MGRMTEVLKKAGKAGYGEDIVEHKSSESNTFLQYSERNEKGRHDDMSGVAAKSTSFMQGKWDGRLHAAVNDDPNIPEIFKVLRSRILHPGDGLASAKTIMITSAIPNEGKSFVAANLGISFAQGMDQYALIVDCDLRTPGIARKFGISGDVGLVDYLRDDKSVTELIRKTSINKLSVIPGGIAPVNPAELLSSQKMKGLVEELSSKYDDRKIIFVSPPALTAAESTVLAEHVDGIVLVVRQGKAGRPQIDKFKELMGKNRILGMVFNDHSVSFLEKRLMKSFGYPYQGNY